MLWEIPANHQSAPGSPGEKQKEKEIKRSRGATP